MAQENAVNINRRPYLLAPDRPPEGQARQMRDGETESEVAPHMKERANNLGLKICRPSWSPNTMLVHRSEEHTSELQSQAYLVCRLLLDKKKCSYYFP